jgi:tRNA nucleotidyltransferase (CCA-adding enzyme)
VAARKLYPGSELLLSPSVGRNVHPYLALHRDYFGGVSAAQVAWASIQRLIVVDVRRESRLAHVARLLERRRDRPDTLQVILYDHHPARADDLQGDQEQIEPVGSTTTLLSERLEAERIALSPIEATLLALGLHTDTGSFSFCNTTSRDARALAYLLASGADSSVLTRYLHVALDATRRLLIAQILGATELHERGGASIGVACVPASRRLSGLDDVTMRAHDLLGCMVLFVIYDLGRGKLQIIGRSRTGALDIGVILAAWGGGGQRDAAAATRSRVSPEQAKEQLLQAVERQPLESLTARDLMSSPVHTVSTEEPLGEVARRLAEWRHGGAVVLRAGEPTSVISRSDVVRAEQRGELHLPVKSCMPQRLLSTGPDAALEELAQRMEKEDIGRLPVLDAGRLIGIVSRSDVLRALYR